MRRAGPSFAISLSLAVALVGSAAWGQSDEEKAAARSLAKQGAEALQAGKYSDAIDLVTRAEAIVHAPTHLLLMGRAQEGLGKLIAAQETFLKVAREDLAPSSPGAFKKAQQDAKDELRALEQKIPQLKVVVQGAEGKKFTVKMDDQPMPPALIGVFRPVDPGKHAIGVYAPGATPAEQSIDIGQGEKKEMTLPMPTAAAAGATSTSPSKDSGAGSSDTTSQARPTERKPLIALGIAGVALGVVGLSVGTVFVIKYSATSSDANDRYAACPCTQEEQDKITALDQDAAKQGTISAISFIGGAVLTAGGVAALVIGTKPPKREPVAPSGRTVTPWIGARSIGVVGTF